MMITFTPMTTTGGNNGNYYYGARYYNPTVSVWLSVDPLASEFPSHSPYNYTLNNPINMIDPDGRAPLPCQPSKNNIHSNQNNWHRYNNAKHRIKNKYLRKK